MPFQKGYYLRPTAIINHLTEQYSNAIYSPPDIREPIEKHHSTWLFSVRSFDGSMESCTSHTLTCCIVINFPNGIFNEGTFRSTYPQHHQPCSKVFGEKRSNNTITDQIP